jgi:hypothetical protein
MTAMELEYLRSLQLCQISLRRAQNTIRDFIKAARADDMAKIKQIAESVANAEVQP